MPKDEKKKAPKLPPMKEIIKETYRDIVSGIKELKNDLPNMREKLKNPVKTQYELGLHHAEKGNLTDAKFRFWITTIMDKNNADAWYRLGWAYYCKGKINKAKTALHKALELNPKLKEAQFWLDNINEKTDIKEIPLEIIKEDANRWADIYEKLFLIDLQYIGHDAVSKNILDDAEGKSILDLGCGTGLCGELLRHKAKRIVGVDISPKMLKHARSLSLIPKEAAENESENESETKDDENKKSPPIKAYDEVVESDIISYLKTADEKFDTIIAAYTFNFFRELSELITLCKKTLNPNGKLAFSVELTDNGNYEFDPAVGMFIHSDKYIRKTLDENGFKVIKDESVKLYSDCVNGMVYTCQLEN